MGHGDLAKIWDDASMAHVTALERKQLDQIPPHQGKGEFDDWGTGAEVGKVEGREGKETLFNVAITMAIQHYNLYFQEDDDDMPHERELDNDVYITNYGSGKSFQDNSFPIEYQGQDQEQYRDQDRDYDIDTTTNQSYDQSYTDHHLPDQSSTFDGWKYEEEKDLRDDVSNDALLAQLEQEKEEMELKKLQQQQQHGYSEHGYLEHHGSDNDDELVARLQAEEYQELYTLEARQCTADQALTPQQMAVRMVQRNLEAFQLSQTGMIITIDIISYQYTHPL